MAKRNRITSAMSQTIAESSPLIKSASKFQITEENGEILEVDVSKLEKNPYQPRIDLNIHALNELISSIENNGLLQPIVVTKIDNKYFIVAGHRRVEAYKIIGKKTIKATMLKNIGNKELAILSLTENLMRENLHPIENAISIKHLLDQGIVESQNKLAEYIGLSKGHISKMMTIIKLPISIIEMVKKINYRDINILVLINKLDNEHIMISAFDEVKNMSRGDAEKYLNHTYFSKPMVAKNIFNAKITASKINIEINIKDLDEKIIQMIKSKINEISKELKK